MNEHSKLNSEFLLDYFLLEKKGWVHFGDGLRMFQDNKPDAALGKFSLAIRYISYDFRTNAAPPLERTGLLLDDPNDFDFLMIDFDSWIEQHHHLFVNIFRKETRITSVFNGWNEFGACLEDLITSLRQLDKTISSELSLILTECCFLFSYSNKKTLQTGALELVEILIQRGNTGLLLFYTKMKMLLRLDRENEIFPVFEEIKSQCRYEDWWSFASIRYIYHFINRKENSLGYLSQILRFYINFPYSFSAISLLAKYQFDNLLEIKEKDIHLFFGSELENKDDLIMSEVIMPFKRLIGNFADKKSNFSSEDKIFIGFQSPALDYKELTESIRPHNGNYTAIKFLQYFYKGMQVKKIHIDALIEDEMKASGNYEEPDVEYDEPYTKENFIDDVFEGDASNSWNIE